MFQKTITDSTDNNFYIDSSINQSFDSISSQISEKDIWKQIDALSDDYKVPFSMFLSGYHYDEIAEKIGPVIGREKADLVKIFQSKRSGILLASGVSEDITDKLISLRLNGFEFIQKYSRFYPQDDLVADVVGYVNLDRRGQAGVEYSQEKLLERSGQTVRMSKSGNGSLMPDYATEGFLHFDDLLVSLTSGVFSILWFEGLKVWRRR
jgi:cell division protein FtsI/penicillin-binding protein 2